MQSGELLSAFPFFHLRSGRTDYDGAIEKIHTESGLVFLKPDPALTRFAFKDSVFPYPCSSETHFQEGVFKAKRIFQDINWSFFLKNPDQQYKLTEEGKLSIEVLYNGSLELCNKVIHEQYIEKWKELGAHNRK